VSTAIKSVVNSVESKLSLMPIYGAPDGWLARLYGLGVRGTCHKGPFGCEKWVFKKDGEFILATQDYHLRKALVLTNPTDGQKTIVDALLNCGLLKQE
jgi:hypothetical protein